MLSFSLEPFRSSLAFGFICVPSRLSLLLLLSSRIPVSALAAAPSGMPTTPSAATRSTVAVLARQRFKAARRVLLPQWNIVRGDLVEVRTGREKGKQGVVKAVLRGQNRVLLTDLNLRSRKISATPQATGFMKALPSPLHISSVALVDPLQKKAARVRVAVDDSGRRVRVSRLSGAVIPRPAQLPEKGRGHRTVNSATDTPEAAVRVKSIEAIDFDAIAAHLRDRRREVLDNKREEEGRRLQKAQQQKKAASALSQGVDPSDAASALALAPTIDLLPSSDAAPVSAASVYLTPVASSSSPSPCPPWLSPSRRHFPARLPSLPPFPYVKASALVGQWSAIHQRRTAPPGLEYIYKP